MLEPGVLIGVCQSDASMSRRYGKRETIFENVDAFNPRVDTYRPDEVPERQSELDEIYDALSPVEIGGTPINLLVYGETGQGKTVGVDIETTGLQGWAESEGINYTVLKVSCKGADKSYNVLDQLVKKLREERHGSGEDLPKGYQKKELLNMALEEMEQIGGTTTIILDEIDGITEDHYILYELPRANLDGAKLSIIGITNDLTYTNRLDDDIRSSLGEDEVVFEPYDALDLKDILARRSVKALRDTGFSCDECDSADCGHDVEETIDNLVSDTISMGAINLCAAFSAQETGDARRALKLIYKASRLTDQENGDIITEDSVKQAHKVIEEQAIVRGITTLPTQKLTALMALTYNSVTESEPGETQELYQRYKKYANARNSRTVSLKRFREFLSGLENKGFVRLKQGQGRGVENKYWLDVDTEMLLSHLPEGEDDTGDLAATLRERWE